MSLTISTKNPGNVSVDRWFIVAYLGLYLIPFMILLIVGELNLAEAQTREHLIFSILYILSYLTSGLILWLLLRVAHKRPKQVTGNHLNEITESNRCMANKVATSFGWVSVLIIVIYYAAGGYKKILLLGSDIDSVVYRIIGYDDTSRVLTALLELARRILMPYALLIKLSFEKYNYSKDRLTLSIFTVAAILGAIVNLDRGPIFLYMALFFFFYYFTSEVSTYRKTFSLFVFITAVGLMGSVVTLLQYNMLDFDLASVYQSFFSILLDRIVLDPVRMGELYSFGDSSLLGNPLYLKYSRLGALFGSQYVGTESEYSMYVAPVGLVGDVWRNFGMPGAVYVGLAHGMVFKYLSRLLRMSDLIISLPIYFLFIILILYMFYSGLFSQGPFALLLVIFIMARLSRRNAA